MKRHDEESLGVRHDPTVSTMRPPLAALDHPHFTTDELREIDRYAVDSGINLWRTSSDL